MNLNSISVIDAAGELGLEKRAVFKVLKRLGIDTFTERSTNRDHKGQAIAYLTLEDFEALKIEIESRRVVDATSLPDAESEIAGAEFGVFYLIQLEPDHDPGRLKVGFAVSIAERLRSHRCSAPFAVVIKTWPCKRLWERTAIDCVTTECQQLHTEVFRATDVQNVASRCDAFFAMMPTLSTGAASNGSPNGEQPHALERAIGPFSNGESSPHAQ